MAANMTDKQKKEYRDAFALFDKDKDGFISTEELGTVMRSLGHTPTPTEVRELISEGVPGQYTERGGKIDFNLFCSLMVRRPAPSTHRPAPATHRPAPLPKAAVMPSV